MKNILIFLFICFGFALNSQITITCYECKKNTTVDCKGCNIQSNLFTGIVIKEKGKPDIPLYEPYKVSNKSSVFTFEDAFGTKTIVNVTSVLSYNTPKKLYDYLSNCLCKPSTIDTDTDRYSVLIQDSILVTYDINGVEIDRDTIRLFDIDTDTKTFLVQDSILVYYDIQNNEIGRDTIKIPFVDTDIQTYLTQDSILVYYDESNTEIDRDTIDIPNITEQGNFRISNDTLYHNNSIDGIEQFVKLPSIDTTTQSYLPILNGLDTIGYENITYLGGVEVDRDTITLPLHKNQVQSNETQAVPYTGVELPPVAGVNVGDTKTVQFNDGTVVNYTWNGSIWVKDFEDEYNFVGEINIVIDGQSNSIGQQAGSTFPLKVLNNLKVWNGSNWVNPQLGVAPFNPNGADNMGLRFAEKLAIENPQHRIKLIQLGNNGFPLSHWIASPYTGLFNVLNTLNSSGIPRVDVFIWDQGESDNLNTNYISEYYSGLIANLLSFPQIDDRTKFLNVGMYTGPGALYPLKDADFRAIGIDDNEYTSYVNTDNLLSYDNVHWTNEDMLKLGYERIYNAYLNTPYQYRPDPTFNDITPWRLAGSGGATKTNNWTDEISTNAGIRVLSDYAPTLAGVIVNPTSRDHGILVSGNATNTSLLIQQSNTTAKGLSIDMDPAGQSGIALEVISKSGLNIFAEKQESPSNNNFKLNGHSIFSQKTVGTPSNLFGSYQTYSAQLTNGSSSPVGLLGWYWENSSNTYGNINIGTQGVGNITDDHLNIIGRRLLFGVPYRGVEINRWLKIGEYQTTNGTFINPRAVLDLETPGNTSSTIAIKVSNLSNIDIFTLRDDGVIELNSTLTSLPPAPSTGAGIVYFSGDYYKWSGGAWVLF
jgi:hypothetical protein